jgi:hypothetical protein
MTLTLCPFRLLISVRDAGCTTVGVTAVVCLGTAVSPWFQLVTQAPSVFLSATAVSGRQWRSHRTDSLFSVRPYVGR